MKKLYLIFGCIVIASQLITMEIPILSSILWGFSIKYLLYYFFVGITVAVWICGLIAKKSAPVYEWLFIPFMLLPTVIGLLNGIGFMAVFADFSLYCMPIVVYMWAKAVKPDVRSCMIFFLAMNIFAAILSVFVSAGLLTSNIWAAEGQLIRTAGAIDSTLSMGGVTLCLVLLFTREGEQRKINKVFLYISLAASLLASLLAQSRTRIVLILICALLVCIFNIYDKKFTKTVKLAVGVIAIAIIAYFAFSEYIDRIFEQIFERFEGAGIGGNADGNVTARQKEQSAQLKAFLESPVLGHGYGIRENYSGMYVHNIYTSLLMQTGAVGFLIYIFWLFSMMIPSVKRVLKRSHSTYDVVVMFFATVLVVLGFTNASVFQSGGYFMLLIMFVIERKKNEDEESLTV